MDSLIKEIGLAPSELSLQEAFNRVSIERTRVGNVITEFLTNPVPTKSKGRKKSTSTKRVSRKKNSDYSQVNDMLQSLGVTVEDLLKEG